MTSNSYLRVLFLLCIILLNVFATPLNYGLEDSATQDSGTVNTANEDTPSSQQTTSNSETTSETKKDETAVVQPEEETPTESEETSLPIETVEEEQSNNENTQQENQTLDEPNKTEVPADNTTQIDEDNSSNELKDFEIIDSNSNLTVDNITEETNITLEQNETQYLYADIEKVNEELEQVPEESNEIIKKIIQENGLKELEYEIEENSTLQIFKEDTIISENELEVKVYSNEHFNDELRVYATLPAEAKKNEIYINWENEKENLVGKKYYDIEYYDENDNGLIDRISWIVPHLSEQYFKIVVIPSEINTDNSSEIKIKTISPVENQTVNATNPVVFNFTVDYANLSNLDCTLQVNGSVILNATKSNISIEDNLENGNYFWKIYCQDTADNTINAQASGNITVYETAPSISVNSTIYSTKENVYFNANALHENNLTASLVNASTGNLVCNKTITSGQNYFNSSCISNAGSYTLFITSYNLSRPVNSNYQNISVVKIDTTTISNAVTTSQNASIRLDISSPMQDISWITVDYNNDGIIDDAPAVSGKTYSTFLNHKYLATGNYTPLFKISMNNRVFEINSEKITVTTTEDTQDPLIILISPEDEDIINNNTIEFIYKVADNVKISNCTLRIYNASIRTNGFWEILDLTFPRTSADNTTAINTNVQNNTEIKTTLVKFDNRSYSWEVECYDNSSNEGYASNYFSVNKQTISTTENTTVETAATYEYEDEVKEMIDKINSFMEREKTMSNEEKKAIEDLNIINELKSDKNRLTQIDQDFKFNLKYITNPSLKETKIADLTNEIKEFRGSIPYNLEVLASKEYVKNSINTNIEEVVLEYLDATNTKIDAKYTKNIVKNNAEIQNKVIINTNVKKVSIEYSNGTRDLVIVTKELDYENNITEKKILEVFPDGILDKADGYKFITENKEIVKNKIFEFNLDKLKDKKIIYYIESNLDLEDVEKIDSLLFSDTVVVGGSIFTGYAIGDSITDSFSLAGLFLGILILIVLIMIVIVVQKMRVSSWKREPNVRRIFELLEETKKKIIYGELEVAKANYEKMRQIYQVLPQHTKPYLYAKIKIIENAIDKRDILNLLKEYDTARREYRKEEAIEIYAKISKIYLKLPKEIREKIYPELSKKI